MRITIFTPTIDSSDFVDEAVASVPLHEHADVEHIVVHDGGETLPRRLAARYPWLKVLPGPGRGATAAAAVAIRAATGDFVFPLNSDDRMVAGAITALVRAVSARPQIQVWTGGTRIFETGPDGAERTIRILDETASTSLDLFNALDDLPLLTARFIHRVIYERLGPWDETFSTCSDREFAIRMVLTGASEASLGVRVSELRQHGQSQTIRRDRRGAPGYLYQHLVLARRWMHDSSLPPSTRAAFRDWYAREALRVIYLQARGGELRRLPAILAAAFREDPVWPWRARTIGAALRRRRRAA